MKKWRLSELQEPAQSHRWVSVDLEHESLISHFLSTILEAVFLGIQFQVQWLLNYISLLDKTATGVSQRTGVSSYPC